ncbi:MAG: UvrD-helicase domain-containing protein [Phycisphaerales bacterium]|nr:UvrD-helicase domain-containing protein [Phycisphaerales bacterium]
MIPTPRLMPTPMTHPADDPILDGLTEPQRLAVTHVDGPLLVLAGPGSGKTRVITNRIAHLVQHGIAAWQILALTFTNKAAAEMRERIDRLVPADLPGRQGMTVSTFHSFCVRVLRRYADAARLPATFSLYDAADQRDALKQAMARADLDTRNWTPAAVAAAISSAKNRLLDADAYAAAAADFRARGVAKAYLAYEKTLRGNDALDFDDLLMRTCLLLKGDASVREELQARYQYVLIDEYQDTNHAQFVIAHTLAAEHRNICVVGDPDQSIYAWRGADISNILEFEAHYGDATVIALGQNFRSTAHILELAAALIKHNRQRKDKPLYSELGDGETPEYVICRDEQHEAMLVADHLRRRHDESGVPWRNMAVLYRINALSRVLEEAFRRAQIPYVIARGTAFYDRKEIKDALAYLRALANPSDEVSLRRIVNTPTRGIGKTSLDRVEILGATRQQRLMDAMRQVTEQDGVSARAVKAMRGFVAMFDRWRASMGGRDGGVLGGASESLADLVGRVIQDSGLETALRKSSLDEDRQRLENLGELVSAAAEFVPPPAGDLDAPATWTLERLLQSFLETITLVSDADMVDPENGAVTLLTLHAAKGLEFDTIAIVGLEEGVLPHTRASESEAELEEERRLCFVGITRAERSLLLSRAAVRTIRGMRNRTIESQFVGELPAASFTRSDQAGVDDWYDSGAAMRERLGLDRESEASDAARAFPPGCLVHHPMFGRGRVESIVPHRTSARARVVFETVGAKMLVLEYAKLRRLDD